MAGLIHIDLFSSLDGVAQSPGSRAEDPDGGFAYGGWQAPVDDSAVGQRVMAGIRRMDALLLGRRTYDIFAAYWPQYEGPAAEIAERFTAIPKYVASRGTPPLPWVNSHRLGADLAAEIAALRERHAEVHVVGSIEFARGLVQAGLFDVLNLWVYPLVLGPGKRLFPPDGPAFGLTLLEPPIAGPAGALLLRYGPGPAVTTADMG
ncbi:MULTISPECIES: dihydrofolate reductase family protein [unclassified Microbacterium]|uniref:dihydrofolate reductase family protein n=1 Tax=unclassified Microbacterium TaxID=2609290 RepID=UPI00214BCF66|nr:MULTISPECIES: dihydrofolate reductase family protein [unclassified Microbacterium]MCR2800327.1 dihydrofolate reductase family protein [Microbacterium sp. zg.Y818]MCR2824987.1 dihydrofolate reductase family protein [Microbacterium sp. zg.Y909]WIM22288.1 dihydrofolate reductase family protein [Microbacterium sp. zg-Y818]